LNNNGQFRGRQQYTVNNSHRSPRMNANRIAQLGTPRLFGYAWQRSPTIVIGLGRSAHQMGQQFPSTINNTTMSAGQCHWVGSSPNWLINVCRVTTMSMSPQRLIPETSATRSPPSPVHHRSSLSPSNVTVLTNRVNTATYRCKHAVPVIPRSVTGHRSSPLMSLGVVTNGRFTVTINIGINHTIRSLGQSLTITMSGHHQLLWSCLSPPPLTIRNNGQYLSRHC